MRNLYEEIVNDLKECNQLITDIEWVSIDNKSIPIDDFLNSTKKINYDGGYGKTYINKSLAIKTREGYMLKRNNYDGAEWFEVINTNTPQRGTFTIKDICDDIYY